MPCSSSSSSVHRPFSIFAAGSSSSLVRFPCPFLEIDFPQNLFLCGTWPRYQNGESQRLYLKKTPNLRSRALILFVHCARRFPFRKSPCNLSERAERRHEWLRRNQTATILICHLCIFCCGRCLFGRRCISFPWRLGWSVRSRGVRTGLATLLPRTMRPQMGLHPGNDRRGRCSGPGRFGLYSGSPPCQIVISSTLSHHLQR